MSHTNVERDQYINNGGGTQNVTNYNYDAIHREFVSSLGPTPVANEVEDPVIPRDDVIKGIDAAFQSGQHRYTLHGPMGLGKTTAAYQYAQSWLRSGRPWMSGGSSTDCHVRWFLASDRTQLQAEYLAFAEHCFGGAQRFQGRRLDEIRPMVDALVMKTPNVLLVFDGVEDDCIVEDVVSNLLSMGAGVFVLVTTMHETIYPRLDPSCRAMLDAFSDQQVSQYLTETWHPHWTADDISELQESQLFQQYVNCHPKRLNWLSALIRNRPTMTVRRLLNDLESAAERRAVDPVFTIVVDALIADCERTNTRGWTLLCYAARLASAPIPVEVLRSAMGLSEPDMDAAVQSLRKFSLSTLSVVSTMALTMQCLSLHSLARGEVAIYNAASNPSFSSVAGNACIDVTLLTAMLLPSRAESRESLWQQRQLIQHVQFLLAATEALDDDPQTASQYFHDASILMRDSGSYSYAVTYALKALEMKRKVLPDPHLDIASSLNNIGTHYSEVGDYAQGLKYALEALAMKRKVLPDPHPGIATGLSNVGTHYREMGDYSQALKYALEALEMRRKVLPDPHPDIATALNNVGTHYRDVGDYAQALNYALESLEMKRKVLPDPHPGIATGLSNVGNRYRDMGDYALALKYALEGLDMMRKVMPDPHANIGTALNNVGNHYRDVGDHAQALKYALEALAMMRIVLPDPHSGIATSLSNLGNHFSTIGSHAQALKYALEALEMRRLVLPESHIDIRSSESAVDVLRWRLFVWHRCRLAAVGLGIVMIGQLYASVRGAPTVKN